MWFPIDHNMVIVRPKLFIGFFFKTEGAFAIFNWTEHCFGYLCAKIVDLYYCQR